MDDLSSTVRDITLVSSAHDCMLSPGRLSTTACADYFLLMGRLSASTNGINALERAGIFQEYVILLHLQFLFQFEGKLIMFTVITQ